MLGMIKNFPRLSESTSPSLRLHVHRAEPSATFGIVCLSSSHLQDQPGLPWRPSHRYLTTLKWPTYCLLS